MSILLDGDLAGMLRAGKAWKAPKKAPGELNGPLERTAAVSKTSRCSIHVESDAQSLQRHVKESGYLRLIFDTAAVQSSKDSDLVNSSLDGRVQKQDMIH
jgi:hypothetical protein